nr:hypothetical protein [Tanacetum cinerariifolium]
MVEGKWIDEPDMVKKEFLDHFTNRFCKPVKSTASIDADFPNQLDSDQQSFLERDVTNAEIKKAVWECGISGTSWMWTYTLRVSGLKINLNKSKLMGIEVDYLKWLGRLVLEKKGIHLLNYMHMNMGNGFATSFWDDRWCTDGRLKDLYPRVYALNHKKITVGEKLAQLSLVYSFRRVPRGGAESSQVEELKRLIQPVILKQGKDSWNWSLSKSGTYLVASVRNLIDSSLLPSSDMKTRWISYIPNKVNVVTTVNFTNFK